SLHSSSWRRMRAVAPQMVVPRTVYQVSSKGIPSRSRASTRRFPGTTKSSSGSSSKAAISAGLGVHGYRPAAVKASGSMTPTTGPGQQRHQDRRRPPAHRLGPGGGDWTPRREDLADLRQGGGALRHLFPEIHSARMAMATSRR